MQRQRDVEAERHRQRDTAGEATREFTGFTPTPPIPAPIVGIARPRVEFVQFQDCAAVFVNGRRDAVLRDESAAVHAFCRTLDRLGAIELVKTDQQHLTFLV